MLLYRDLVGLLFLFCFLGGNWSCEAAPLVSGIKNKDVEREREKIDLKNVLVAFHVQALAFLCFSSKMLSSYFHF